MPKSNSDLTNPRYLLSEIHRIVVGRHNWEPNDTRKLNRWIETTHINKNSDRIFLRLRDEIIKGMSELFPVHMQDGIKFIANKGADPYVGQLFHKVIFQGFSNNILPFLIGWIHTLNNEKEIDSHIISYQRYNEFLQQMLNFESKYGNEILMTEIAFSLHLGKNWYLPKYVISDNNELRLALPVERLFERIILLKGASSRNNLAKKATNNFHSDEEVNFKAYESLKKSFHRLRSHNILPTLGQLNLIRSVPFSSFIIDNHWENKSDEEKNLIIQEHWNVFNSSPMSHENAESFNKTWRKMYEDQNKYFKDSVDGIYELGLIMTYLISKVILDLEIYFPETREEFAELAVLNP